MGIMNVTPGQVGLVGVLPSIAYIETDDPVATVTATGYLNKEVANGAQFNLPCIAAVTTMETPTSVPAVGWYELQHVGANWSLQAGSNTAIALTNGHIFVGNASNIATDVAMSGDITISNAGVTAIGAGKIVNAQINAAAAIDFSKLAALTSGNILVGSVSNVPTSVAMSGDGTLSNTGALTIAAGAISGSKIANNAVDYAQLALDVGATATVNLTAAQIKALYDTPVQLIAAPGSGKLIIIDNILWDIAFVSAQYAAGGAIAAQYGNTVHGAGAAASGSLAAASLNGVAASGYLSNAGISGSLSVTSAASLNTAVYLSNASGDFTTGDSTVTLYIRYRVITPA